MKTIVILVLLGFNFSYCQDFDYLKKMDTIYVIFKGNKSEKINLYSKVKGGYKQRWYSFYTQKNKSNEINFSHQISHFKGDSVILRKENDVQKIDKSFLKKNKNKIIGMNFFKKYDICTLSKILNTSKIFYIIDYTEKKDGKIPIYEVGPPFLCNIED